MWRLLKQMLMFRLGQKSARGAARVFGFRRLGTVIGLIGGWRAMKQHRHA